MVHLDYSSAFDSMSHIYLFGALKRSGASAKTLQLFKAIYSQAMVMVRVGDETAAPFTIGRGVLEGDVFSPMAFNIGLEQIFRQADELNSMLAPLDGVQLRGATVDKVVFADDVTLMGSDTARATTTVQNVQFSSGIAGLNISVRKSHAQHIGRCRGAPAVTPMDIASLKLTRECPKPWCTRRFGTMEGVRAHVLWHDKHEGGMIDSARLSVGVIMSARGPPEHRFYHVFWVDGPPKWVLHKHFTPNCQHLIEIYFSIHFYLDRASNLQVPWEHRCVQCNQQCNDRDALELHVLEQHTYPVRRGSRDYRRSLLEVQQRFQDGLPKVLMRNGIELGNRYLAKWVGMTFAANRDEAVHVDRQILLGHLKFAQYRSSVRSSSMRTCTKISIYKGVALSRATFGCETVYLTSNICRKYRVFNARCLSAISGRTISDETREPSFDIIAWILWRRAVWLGKALRGVKGNIVLSTLRWNFTRKMRGDIFYHLPSNLKTSFQVLSQHACDLPGWIEFCDSIKPPPWKRSRCRRVF